MHFKKYLPLLAGIPVVLLFTAARPHKSVFDESVERGRYLVSYGGCNDCHTPLKLTPQGPVPDMDRLLSGHPQDVKVPKPQLNNGPWSAATAGMTAWAGPWGVSFASNLTPDENTGIGIWTEYMFMEAMRRGKHMGAGRDILPPMPWRSVAALTDEDLRAVYAYLRSIPPIKNRVPDPLPPGGPQSFE